jgi:hypothetical protein
MSGRFMDGFLVFLGGTGEGCVVSDALDGIEIGIERIYLRVEIVSVLLKYFYANGWTANLLRLVWYVACS